jgi:hypothetical protein
MSGLDDLNRAAEQARAQVRQAREALAVSREARDGGPARDRREAERQMLTLRGAVEDDIRALRDRLTGQDPSASRSLRIAALTASGAIAGVVGVAALGRGALSRGSERRRVERQALAVARVLADQARAAAAGVGSATSRPAAPTRRRRGSGTLLLAAVGAAVAGAVIVQQRRAQPVDPDDLWLPEETVGPA